MAADNSYSTSKDFADIDFTDMDSAGKDFFTVDWHRIN